MLVGLQHKQRMKNFRNTIRFRYLTSTSSFRLDSKHCGLCAKKFIDELGKQITQRTNEKRSTVYLKQRISIDIQRGNAISVLGTIPSTESLDEIFYLLSKQNLN